MKMSWKRKVGGSMVHSAPTAFKEEQQVEEEKTEPGVDWLTAAKRRKGIMLEDGYAKSKRLKSEGSILAQAERYWEALSKWEEAEGYTPHDAILHEMKAQAYMELCEVYPALQSALRAVKLDPKWWIGYQTLGRAQMGLGEVQLAVVSFSKAIHLRPDIEELWETDLKWASSLLEQYKKVKEEESQKTNHPSTSKQSSGVQITEIDKEEDEEEENKEVVQWEGTEEEEKGADVGAPNRWTHVRMRMAT